MREPFCMTLGTTRNWHVIERLRLSAIIFTAAAIWGLLLIFGGTAVPPGFMQPFSKVVAYSRCYLLRSISGSGGFPILRQWLVKRPVLAGTWRTEVRSNWIDPAGQQITPIAGYMAVRQETFSTLSLCLITQSRGQRYSAQKLSEVRTGAIAYLVSTETSQGSACATEAQCITAH